VFGPCAGPCSVLAQGYSAEYRFLTWLTVVGQSAEDKRTALLRCLRAAERRRERPRGARARREQSRRGCASDKNGRAECVAPTRDGRPKGGLNNGAAALMRETNEIGSGARARQERGVLKRSAPHRSYSSLDFDLRQENRRAVQRFAQLRLLYTTAEPHYTSISEADGGGSSHCSSTGSGAPSAAASSL